jgi:NO-binding membrane sensor protein with MHYT domain
MPVVMIKSDPRAREKPCLRCGYSLRKIDATHCPECGLSVWLSLNNNDGLDASHPEWLRQMSSALWAMAAAQLLGLFPFAFATLYQFGLFVSPTSTLYYTLHAANLSTVVYLAVYHAGLILLTQAERRYPDRLKAWRVAAWISSSIAALFVIGMLATILRFTTFIAWHLPLLGVLLASAIVTLGHLRNLARRIPSSRLARICSILMFLPAIPFLKVFPFIGAFLLFQFAWVFEFLPVLYLPISAVLFTRFALHFQRAATAAEQHWQSETAQAPKAA